MSTVKDVISAISSVINLFEKPTDNIIEKRIKIIQYLSTLYRICFADSAQGVHDKIFSAYAELLDKNLLEDEKMRIIDNNNQEQLETILAMTNTFFCRYNYEILNDIVIKLRNCLQFSHKSQNWIPKNTDEFCTMLESLQYLIKLMKHQLYRKRLFGRWFPQLTLCCIR